MRVTKHPVLWLTVLISLAAVLPGRYAAAQTGTQMAAAQISRNVAKVDFPEQVAFELEWAPDSRIVEAVLVYDVEQDSCVEAASRVPVEVEGSRAAWTWVMVRSGNPPPGSRLWWEWELVDADGQRFTTPRQEITLEDNRFDWRTLSDSGISLHWYRGDEVGPLLLDAAVAGLAQLQKEMGIELQDEVQIFIYGSSSDMQDAVLYIQDWAGGVAFSEYNVILIGVPPNIAEDWGRKTVRHELAHLVVGQFGRSCLGGSRPTWLNEGLAVMAEGDLQPDFAQALRSATADNSFEPVRSLNGAFPAHDEAAGIAYAQSYSVVNFLLDQYGQERMQELLLTLAEGRGYDQALTQVYGMNVDGVEQAWRESIGVPPRSIPPTPTPLVAALIPTVELPGVPRSVPTPPSAAEPPPASPSESTGGCALGMIPLVLIGAVGVLPGRRWRRKGDGQA